MNNNGSYLGKKEDANLSSSSCQELGLKSQVKALENDQKVYERIIA